MIFPGKKSKRIYDELISLYLPNDIENWIYVEPFGGTFSINTYLPKRPKLSVYNDIKDYKIDIKADKIHHVDYREIIQLYDTDKTIFYLDPPYFNKEYLYDLKDFTHSKLFLNLLEIQGKFILSYENVIYIKELYKKVVGSGAVGSENLNMFFYSGNYKPLRNEMIITNHTTSELRKLKLDKLNNI